MPDCASLLAAARPIPLVAPVMRAVVVIGALLLSFLFSRRPRRLREKMTSKGRAQ
jgi:hypothetical protein